MPPSLHSGGSHPAAVTHSEQFLYMFSDSGFEFVFLRTTYEHSLKPAFELGLSILHGLVIVDYYGHEITHCLQGIHLLPRHSKAMLVMGLIFRLVQTLRTSPRDHTLLVMKCVICF